MKIVHWTKEEKERLAELVRYMPHVEIAQVMGRSRKSVECMAKLIGVKRQPAAGEHTIETPCPGVRIITHRMGG